MPGRWLSRFARASGEPLHAGFARTRESQRRTLALEHPVEKRHALPQRMNASKHRPDPAKEYLSEEGCWILETSNTDSDAAVSIARARVAAGVTTQLHRLRGVTERYVILSGTGVARVGMLAPIRVVPGDVVSIPPEVPQQITNDGTSDLIFYCVCTPRFTPACYESL